MVENIRLLSEQSERARGFESHSLRQQASVPKRNPIKSNHKLYNDLQVERIFGTPLLITMHVRR